MSANHVSVAIVGNGAIANAVALELSFRAPSVEVAVFGLAERPGCASLAAGAMLNSFAELEHCALDHPISRFKFEASNRAAKLWPAMIDRLNFKVKSLPPLVINEGTTVVSNACADGMDDKNFDAICGYLREYKEPFDEIEPSQIEGVQTEPQCRPLRAIYIRNEGAISSKALHRTYDAFFAETPNVTIENEMIETIAPGGRRHGLITTSGRRFTADQVVIAAGAASQKFVDQLQLHRKIPRIVYGIGTSLILKSNTTIPTKIFRTPNRGLACGIYVVPYPDNFCYVGATNFISPWPIERPRVTSIYQLLGAAMEQVNTTFYKAEIHKIIVGYRPTTLDTFPVIGETSIRGLWIASGTKRDGFHLSPMIAQELVDGLLNGTAPFENKFRPERPLILTAKREEAIEKSIDHMLSAGYQHELHLPKSNWEPMVRDAIRRNVEEAYAKSGITGDRGIPPEMLDMFRYGHAKDNLQG